MKIRVNDLARELQCKSKKILEAVSALGIDRDRLVTHSSALSEEEANKVRQHFQPRAADSRGLAKSIAFRFGEEI